MRGTGRRRSCLFCPFALCSTLVAPGPNDAVKTVRMTQQNVVPFVIKAFSTRLIHVGKAPRSGGGLSAAAGTRTRWSRRGQRTEMVWENGDCRPSLQERRLHAGSGPCGAGAPNTVSECLGVLKRAFVIEGLPAWNPSLRSKTAVRTSPTRHFADSHRGRRFTGASGHAPARLRIFRTHVRVAVRSRLSDIRAGQRRHGIPLPR